MAMKVTRAELTSEEVTSVELTSEEATRVELTSDALALLDDLLTLELISLERLATMLHADKCNLLDLSDLQKKVLTKYFLFLEGLAEVRSCMHVTTA